MGALHANPAWNFQIPSIKLFQFGCSIYRVRWIYCISSFSTRLLDLHLYPRFALTQPNELKDVDDLIEVVLAAAQKDGTDSLDIENPIASGAGDEYLISN